MNQARPRYCVAIIGLLERDSELDAIRGGLNDVRGGDGRCIVIEGPAGIGKSALVAAARNLAWDTGFRVMSAVGGELEADFPYGVVRQLFGRALSSQPEDEKLLVGAAALARPVLAPHTALDASARAESSYALEALHGLYWLTVNLAGAAPVMIAVDDVQWCDVASLRFLIYLRRRLEGLTVLLLVAGRPREPGGKDHLLAQLGAGVPDIVRPRALSRGAVAVMLQIGLSEEPDPNFAAAAHAASGGNPFLLGELVTALLDAQVRPTARAAGRVAAIGPHGVTRAMLRRLAAVGEGATALARARTGVQDGPVPAGRRGDAWTAHPPAANGGDRQSDEPLSRRPACGPGRRPSACRRRPGGSG